MTDHSIPTKPSRGLRWGLALRSREVAVLVLILAVCAVASVLSPYFLTGLNLSNILIACSVEMIVAAGLAIVLVSGGIDLSVGSVMGACAIALAIVLDAGAPLWLALGACVLVGLAFGVTNGILVAYAGLNPLVLTLATMTIGRSVVYILSQGYSFSAIPQGFKAAFNATPLLGLPNLVWLSLLVAAVLGFLLQRNVWFRRFYFLGGSEVGAIRAGLDTRRLKLWAYVISALLATLAAVVTTARLGSAFPNTGEGLELRVVTAAVIGGCSIYGGKGTILGAALGVLLLNLINNVLVILSLSPYWQGVAAGIVLILAILTDIAGRRGARR